MRRLASVVTVLLLAWPTASLRAQCESGSRPGATLLFPYFEVDLTRADGLTTLISINSSSTAPVLTRVVVWSDWGVPVLGFDLFLNAKDTQTLNLRDLFNGKVPSTSGAELISYPGCVQLPPSYGDPALSVSHRASIAAYLTGTALQGFCKGEWHGDHHARGYVTVDTVNRCSGISEEYYFGVNSPVHVDYGDRFTADNVLWGDMLYVDPAESSAQGVEAVALRTYHPGVSVSNTFYGLWTSGSDRRSPLPSLWSVRFLAGGAFDGGTDFIVFRNSAGGTIGTACGGRPSWYPLVAESLTVYDESGKRLLSLAATDHFPLVTQRVSVSTLSDSFSASFGRFEIGLTTPGRSHRGAWVIPIMTASGRYSVDFNGQPLDNGCGG